MSPILYGLLTLAAVIDFKDAISCVESFFEDYKRWEHLLFGLSQVAGAFALLIILVRGLP